jgi:hypothetical protein
MWMLMLLFLLKIFVLRKKKILGWPEKIKDADHFRSQVYPVSSPVFCFLILLSVLYKYKEFEERLTDDVRVD